jgi:hypothetical protein
MRLIRSAEKGLEPTESPDIAARLVDDALMRGHVVDGLDQFGMRAKINRDNDIVEAVRNGDLLLVKPGLASSGGGFMPRLTPEPEQVPAPPGTMAVAQAPARLGLCQILHRRELVPNGRRHNT